jgi:hypothetical protein
MLMNLIIGLPVMLLCLALQAVATFWSIRFYMEQSGRGMPGGRLFAQVRPLLLVMIVMMLGNFVQHHDLGSVVHLSGGVQRVV